ncbi:MAG: hypothetical protein K2W96_09160 [Gemmataceae bacterium]|nr:hypothetical protein [Gemmataceae bacterium]
MRPEELVQLLRIRPFQPLRILMTDGRTYDIRHPEMVIVQRGRVDIGVITDPASGVADRVDYCSIIHIVRVEPIHQEAAPLNGQAQD